MSTETEFDIRFEATDMIDMTEITSEITSEIWFEACTEHRGEAVDGPCAVCGWLAADHTAGLAEVITVARTALDRPLRRAS